jgi:citronellyl-CoA dehydrogenase
VAVNQNESRYFREEHEIFRTSLRSFIDRELVPHAEQWEEAETFPNEVFKKMGRLGFLGASFPVEHGGSGGDIWYNVVRAQELPYCRSGGVVTGDSCGLGMDEELMAEQMGI